MKRKGADQKKQLPTGPPVITVVAVTRREWVLLGAVLAAGIGLRMGAFSRSAVEHFDEGVYASNIYFAGPEYAYPQQRFYAPPLLPALIEAGMIAGLPPNVAALLPSFLAGCGTIVAVWWFGRSWFGPGVGLSTATLVAFSDFHIAFSATALTDALLGLWLVLAVDAVGRSLVGGKSNGNEGTTTRFAGAPVPATYGDFRWAVGAGIYTGLAWWTKYNGWLPMAIEGAALPLLWLFLRPPARQWIGWLGCFSVTCVVACAVWSPYYFSLQSQGGYEPIAANHAKYVVGLAGWVDSAARQFVNQTAMEGPASRIGLVAALALPGLVSPRAWRNRFMVAGAIAVVGLVTLRLPTVAIMAASSVAGLVQAGAAFMRRQPSDDKNLQKGVGLALVMAWWLGMLVATPIYMAYPRLLLPWLLVSWLATGIYWAGVWQSDGTKEAPSKLDFALLGGLVAVLVVLGVIGLGRPGWRSRREMRTGRDGLVSIAKQIRELNDGKQPRVVYVLGEPALYFQLRAAGEEIVAPAQELPSQAATIDGQPAPTFLLAGPHGNQDPAFREQMAGAKRKWRLVKQFEYQPSAVVWLDLHDPRAAMWNDRLTSEVRLYEFQK